MEELYLGVTEFVDDVASKVLVDKVSLSVLDAQRDFVSQALDEALHTIEAKRNDAKEQTLFHVPDGAGSRSTKQAVASRGLCRHARYLGPYLTDANTFAYERSRRVAAANVAWRAFSRI